MKRIGYSFLGVLALALTANHAAATVAPNSAIIHERIFNDCPGSTVVSINNYPASIDIHDFNLGCSGGANRHGWSFSSDGGATAQLFRNRDSFSFAATVVISGTGNNGEAGLRLSPWWSPLVDGMFNARIPDGEIACFGGRLPFYSFTGAHGILYAKGTPIRMSIDYNPNDVSAINPATIIYTVQIGANVYSSGPLAFDHANPSEDPPYGVWGILNDARAGGHCQYPSAGIGNNTDVDALWTNIVFEAGPTPATPATWGKLKADYR